MVQLSRLLVKRGYIFKNIISASGAYCTFRSEGIAADWALIIGILLQNDWVVNSLTGLQYSIFLNNKKKSVTDIKEGIKHGFNFSLAIMKYRHRDRWDKLIG